MADIVQQHNDLFTDRGGFVLVVDNDAESLVIMAMILQRFGFRVCTASYADKALDMARFSPPSLVVVEMNLRGMTGLALMRRLREEPRTKAVPVLLMMREFSREFVQRCGEAGAMGCLPKPVQADELFRAVSRIMDPHTRRTEFRVPTRLPASVNDVPLDALAGECVTNLSVNGMYIRTEKAYSPDDILNIRLVLHGEFVSVEARVVFRHASGEGRGGKAGVGLQFLTVSPGGRETIGRFIHREVTHGLAPGMS